jgi:hypothetical protein
MCFSNNGKIEKYVRFHEVSLCHAGITAVAEAAICSILPSFANTVTILTVLPLCQQEV